MFDLASRAPANAKNDILSGLTVALALVPEAVAFAFVAGVDPLVGLYAAFMVGLITAVIGGRPGMISGATGALAVVMVALVADHGVEYLFITVVLMGILQVLAGVLRLGKFIRMVPHPVMLGFVNGLAIDGATVYWEGQKTRSKQSKKRKQRRLKNDKELSRPKRRKKEAGSAGVQEGPMKAAAGAVEEAQYSDQVEVSGTDAMAVELSGRWHDELVA